MISRPEDCPWYPQEQPFTGSRLEITSFGQRHTTFIANHHMIQYAGADHVQSVLEGGGQGPICLAWFWVSGGVIVHHDDGRSIVLQGDLDHFLRLCRTAVARLRPDSAPPVH